MKQEPLDKLTGVLTRESLEDMDAAFASRAPGEVWTVLMIDIDDFKIVNDIAGHLTGDRVLQQVAWLLARCVRQTDSVVRFGGDEFLVVLPATGALQAAGVAQRFVEEMGRSHFYDSIRVGASVGLAECEETDRKLSSLIGKADQALYESKAGGKQRLSFFSVNGKEEISFDHFVDRQDPLRQLRSCLDSIFTRGSATVLVTGEAGVGKTRLIEELRHYASYRECRFLRAKYFELGTTGPFSVPAEALCGAIEGMSLEERHQVAEAVGEVLPETSILFGPLPLMPDREPPPPDWARRRMFYSQIERVLAVLAAKYPLVFFVDDVQWAPDQDFDLLGYLVRNAGEARILFIFAMGSPVELNLPTWKGMRAILGLSRSERIDLQPLDRDHSDSMVMLALRDSRLPGPLLDRIHQESGGNPLFIRELLKAMLGNGSISHGGDSGWNYVPETCVSLTGDMALLIASRLDQLGGEARMALRMGSLLPGGFSLQDLAFMTGDTPVEMARMLDEAVKFELVRETPEEDRGEFLFTFVHDCIRSRLEAEMPATLRQHLYNRLGDYFEERYRNGRKELLQKTAFCHCQGSRPDKGAEFALLAARDARSRQALDLQASWLETFLDRAGQSGTATGREMLEAWKELGRLGVLRADYAGAENALRKASSYAISSEDLASISVQRALLHMSRLEPALALEEFTRSISTGLPVDESIEARLGSASARYMLGYPESARNDLEEARDLLDEVDDPSRRSMLEASLLGTLGLIYAETGSEEEGLQMCRNAITLFEDCGSDLEKARSQMKLCFMLRAFPAWEECLRLLSDARKVFLSEGDVLSIMNADIESGRILLHLDRSGEALTCFERCHSVAEATGSEDSAIVAQCGIGRAKASLGDAEAAVKGLENALERARKTGLTALVAVAAASLATVRCRSGEFEKALEVIELAGSRQEREGLPVISQADLLLAEGSAMSLLPGWKRQERALDLLTSAASLISKTDLSMLLEIRFREAGCLSSLGRLSELKQLLEETGCLLDLSLTAIADPDIRRSFSEQEHIKGLTGMLLESGLGASDCFEP